MSWLKEKFWSGKKQRVASCTIDDTLMPFDTEKSYYQQHLKNFMSNGQSLSADIAGYEIVSEVWSLLNLGEICHLQDLSDCDG